MKTKKIIVLISLFFFLSLVGTIIFYQYSKYNLNNDKNWHKIESQEIAEYEPLENYKIENYSDTKIVKNENIGLSFFIPKNWNIEMADFQNKKEIRILSPDFIGGINFPAKGCEIRVGAVHFSKTSNQEIKSQIIEKKLSDEELIDDFQEIIFINEQPALKTLQYENLETGGIITVEKSFGNSLYFWNVFFPSNEKTKCLENFNEFLKLISIKQAPL